MGLRIFRYKCKGYNDKVSIYVDDIIMIMKELAVTLSSLMVHQAASCSDLVEFVGPLISGYHNVLPLKKSWTACIIWSWPDAASLLSTVNYSTKPSHGMIIYI